MDYKDWYNANVVFVQIHIYNRSDMSSKVQKIATYNGESEILLIGGATNMYAIIQTGGKQFSVEEGQEIYVEKLANGINPITIKATFFGGFFDFKILKMKISIFVNKYL